VSDGARLGAIRDVLLDLDGVMYVGDQPIAGAAAAVAALQDAGLGLRFVTNTTERSRAQTIAKLVRMGLDPADEEVVTPAALARRHCLDAGYRTVALIMNDDVKVDFHDLEQVSEGPDAVIMGDLGSAFGFEILNRAFRMVMDGAELVALQKNRFWLAEGGLSLDAGPFVAAIEYATGRKATVVGKPSKSFFELVLEGLGSEPGRAAMVGDDVETDVGGAMRAGLAGILVRTGKYRQDFVASSGITPTATVDSIADVPALIGG
jgi:HAD superfamily hydrolase (TIGR01458 family)